MLPSEKCARTRCTSPHDNCKHTQDGRLYCESCAIRISRANPEVPNLVSIPRLHEHCMAAYAHLSGAEMNDGASA